MAKANRAVKDSLFSSLFGEPEAFKELYGALLGVELPPDVEAQDVTLDHVLFLEQVNDLAYLVGDTVVILVEHQSTVNPNMPLRFLMYVARVYEKMFDDTKKYGRKLLRIPKPVFIVLYNGDEPYPEQETLRLSDAFMEARQLLPAELADLASIELEVKVYNVNVDENKQLVQRSRMLAGYVIFIGKCKEKVNAGKELDIAIEEAINECIEGDILADYLADHGYEVRNMLMTEWNTEVAIRVNREEAFEEGREEGVQKGRDGEKRQIAEKLLKLHAPLDMVLEATGLPLAEIQSLQLQLS
ncbi:MAG: Rpn family recombination-promoting nuclease/putative transposase [Oscillospiraceae bacterium]|jgi:predicted transposase/invertase (TIGR01784 family)|nr:Rpn family recombination-promoting nuclease/putative transposase [Oscillospiraceae bacterium]